MGSWEQEKYSQSYTDEEFENKGESVKPKSWNLIWKSLILITETLKKKNLIRSSTVCLILATAGL